MTKVTAIVIIAIIIGIGLLLFLRQNPPAPEGQNLVRSENQVTPFDAPDVPTPTTPTGPTPDTSILSATTSSTVVISTNKGTITATLYNTEAKRAVENFYIKAVSNFYDKKTFHRVEDWVIQGGDPAGNGTGGGTMPSEYNEQPFVEGSLGMARGGDRALSNDSQFFITKSDAEWLTGDYMNFGIVTEGMDVVKKITVGDTITDIQFINN